MCQPFNLDAALDEVVFRQAVDNWLAQNSKRASFTAVAERPVEHVSISFTVNNDGVVLPDGLTLLPTREDTA